MRNSGRGRSARKDCIAPYNTVEKQARETTIEELRNETLAHFTESYPEMSRMYG